MKKYTHLWWSLTAVIACSLAVLGYYGYQIYQKAPPIPEQVVSTDGATIFTREQISAGQNVWQSIGGQQVGSIWGHGAYVAPDWSADWLHRELLAILDRWSRTEFKTNYASLEDSAQALLRARLKKEVRTNTYNSQTGEITVSMVRAEAIKEVAAHYIALFGSDPDFAKLRDAYAIPANALKDPERKQALTAFFFWASWDGPAEPNVPARK